MSFPSGIVLANDFETNRYPFDFGAYTENRYSLSDVNPHFGSKSILTSGGEINHFAMIPPEKDFYFMADFYESGSWSTGVPVDLLNFFVNEQRDDNLILGLRTTAFNGSGEFTMNGTGYTGIFSSWTPDAWHQVGVHLHMHDTTGAVEIMLNETLATGIYNVDTTKGGTLTGVNLVQYTWPTANQTKVWFLDRFFYVTGASGSWPTGLYITGQRPDADGNFTDWKATGANAYSDVGGGHGVVNNASGNAQTFGYPDVPAFVGRIEFVGFDMAIEKSGDIQPNQIAYFVERDSLSGIGVEVDVPTTGSLQMWHRYDLLGTDETGALYKTGVNATNFGVRLTSG